MKVVILGYGAVGSVLANLLSNEKKVEAIVCGDIGFKKEEKTNKIRKIKIDLTNGDELIKFLAEEKPSVVVNATHPKFNTHVMKSCVQAKVNYVDTASFWDVDPDPKAKIPYKMEQLDYDKGFKKIKNLR